MRKTIAGGWMDESVQRWTTDNGKVIEGVWTGHCRGRPLEDILRAGPEMV
jgi:hypothetical protein